MNQNVVCMFGQPGITCITFRCYFNVVHFIKLGLKFLVDLVLVYDYGSSLNGDKICEHKNTVVACLQVTFPFLVCDLHNPFKNFHTSVSSTDVFIACFR